MKKLKKKETWFNLKSLYFFIVVFVFGFYALSENKDKMLQLKRKLPALDITSTLDPETTELIKTYDQFYGFTVNKNVTHYLGYIKSTYYKINVSVFKNEKDVNGTIYIFHGYLSHSGLMKNVVSFFIKNNYSVVLSDLPGHGLSTGDPANINNFNEYACMVEDVFDYTNKNLSIPYTMIGHSTGASSILEYCYRGRSKKITNIVLLAPLIHNIHYGLSKFGNNLIDSFTPTINRMFMKTSNDKKYMNFIENIDPLQVQKVPLSWAKALYEWNDVLKEKEFLDEKMLIIQGKKDNVVSDRYNIKFLKKRIKKIKYFKIKKARHDLLNEDKYLSNRIFYKILDYIED